MTPCFRPLAAALLVLYTGQLAAEPAPWYQWRSKVDGRLACAQTALGPGWDKASGPYQDSHCQYRRQRQ